MSERTCESCRWWNQIDGPDGECRRYPPQVVNDGDAFPVMEQGDWCGEWEPRETNHDAEPAATAVPESVEPQPTGLGTGKPKSGEIELRVTDIDPAGRTFDLVCREFVVSRLNYDPGDGIYEIRLLPVAKPSWQEMWEIGLHPPTPVAYCIQCADDDPKVHSLSFDKAALSKVVTRHGGKVVPLYLGKP